MANDLIEFYGRECPHCHRMDSLVVKLEKEEKVKVEKMEVWHDEKNAALFQKTDQGKCGGVPFFFNRKTQQFICGETDYRGLKAWATGK